MPRSLFLLINIESVTYWFLEFWKKLNILKTLLRQCLFIGASFIENHIYTVYFVIQLKTFLRSRYLLISWIGRHAPFCHLPYCAWTISYIIIYLSINGCTVLCICTLYRVFKMIPNMCFYEVLHTYVLTVLPSDLYKTNTIEYNVNKRM